MSGSIEYHERWLIEDILLSTELNEQCFRFGYRAIHHLIELRFPRNGIHFLQFDSKKTSTLTMRMKKNNAKPELIVLESSEEHHSLELRSLEPQSEHSPNISSADFDFDSNGNIHTHRQLNSSTNKIESSRNSEADLSGVAKRTNPQNSSYEQRLGRKKTKTDLQNQIRPIQPARTDIGQTESEREQMILFKDFDAKANQRQNEDYCDMEQGEKRKRQKKAVPWLSKSTMQIEDSMLKMHNEIIEFYDYIRPSPKEHGVKTEIFEIVRALITEKYPDAQVRVFGSFATELYLPDGDIDITVLIETQDVSEEKVYDSIHKIIRKQEGILFSDVQYIRKSKVPLVKFTHTASQFQFDISVNKVDGIAQVEQVERMKKCYPEFAPLVLVLKCALKIRNMSETYTGGVGSFLLFCMLLHFLRTVHRKNVYYLLSETLLKFLEFYGINSAEWERKSVMVVDGQQIARNRQSHGLSFISPQDASHDIGKSAFKIRDVLNLFKNRFRVIVGTNFRPRESILKELVNPAMEEFRYFKREREFQN